jgi:hypothetical protein
MRRHMKLSTSSLRVDQRSLVWLLFIFVFEIFILTMSGCSDRTPEDYQRKRVNEELAKIQAIAGNYTGEVTMNANGETLGVLSLDLAASTGVVAASPSNPATQRPVLRGELTLTKAGKDLRIPFNEGFYNPDLKSVQIAIDVPVSAEAGARTYTVEIAGAFQGDALVGSIRAYAYPANALSFTIKKDNPNPIDFQDTDPGQTLTELRYDAPSARMSWVSQPVDGELVFLGSNISDEQELLQLVLPYTYVDVSLNFYAEGSLERRRNGSADDRSGRIFELTFENAELDRRGGTLRGSVRAGSTTQTVVRLECLMDRISEAEFPQAWNCRLFSTAGGEITKMSLQRENP